MSETPQYIRVELEPWMVAIAEAAARKVIEYESEHGGIARAHKRIDQLEKRVWKLYAALAASGLLSGMGGAGVAMMIR